MTLTKFKKKLLTLVRQSACQEKIEQAVYDFFLTKPIPVVQATHPFLARARMNFKGEVFSNVSQLSYNPDISGIKLQRANYLGQQVFYGAIPSATKYADCQSTALIETCMDCVRDVSVSKAYLTLSKWLISRPLTVSILPFSAISCSKNCDFKTANENCQKIITESLGGAQTEASEYFIDSLAYMSDIFCQVENKETCYCISAAYYNVLQSFFRNRKIALDGLVYPSANTDASGMNIVLRKEVVDDFSVYFDMAIMFSMKRNPNNPKDISFDAASEAQKPDHLGNFCFRNIREL